MTARAKTVPAVTIDITDDGTAYTVVATPWPTIETAGHPYVARLVHTGEWRALSGKVSRQTQWTADKLAVFVKKLMATYPKAAA